MSTTTWCARLTASVSPPPPSSAMTVASGPWALPFPRFLPPSLSACLVDFSFYLRSCPFFLFVHVGSGSDWFFLGCGFWCIWQIWWSTDTQLGFYSIYGLTFLKFSLGFPFLVCSMTEIRVLFVRVWINCSQLKTKSICCPRSFTSRIPFSFEKGDQNLEKEGGAHVMGPGMLC